MDIVYYIVGIFTDLAIVCAIGYALVPDKKFPKIKENKKVSGADSVNFIGTILYGFRPLDEKQLKFYGLEPPDEIRELYKKYNNNVKEMSLSERKYLPKFKTKFISLLFPLIPLRTQVIFNEVGDGIFESKFNAIPVEIHWKQAFGILAISYTSLLLIVVILDLLL
ncbi:hypothetical protein MBGDF03_00806 [Thermoplasmatales archaeon SCGC AB-540-F20]|nr:hypothetical protein MBGDF03_00806 [Thermoplasmatales archaeon SCGC AB-540-F20]